tara:strand:+ start:594 stop:1889 length:1296 start_codon:yes stop_codon:yes gene_type:complete
MEKIKLSQARIDLDKVIQDQVEGVSVRSKVIRRLIDKNSDVKQILLLDEMYERRYDAFIVSYDKAALDMSDEDLKTNANKMFEHEGRKFTFKTGQEAKDKTQNFRQINRLRNKLIPELKEGYDLGHKDISILRGNIALVLEKMSKNDPRRKELLALYVIVQQIDAMDNIQGTGAENKIELIEYLSSIAKAGPDVSVSWKKDADIMKGLSGSLQLEAEYRPLNQFKGRLSSWVGGIYSEIIKGNTKAFTDSLGNVDILNLKGSPTIVQDIEKQLVEQLDPSRKRKRPKRTRSSETIAAKKPKTSKVSRKKLKSPKTRVKKTKKQSAIQPLHLIGLINKELPSTVRKNMQSPQLVNRTGRFANSVEITDIVQTPKGFPSFGYTYQRDPYQVFEDGGGAAPWANGQRDPRRLIDRSIRELAVQFAIGRFYTRRV